MHIHCHKKRTYDKQTWTCGSFASIFWMLGLQSEPYYYYYYKRNRMKKDILEKKWREREGEREKRTILRGIKREA